MLFGLWGQPVGPQQNSVRVQIQMAACHRASPSGRSPSLPIKEAGGSRCYESLIFALVCMIHFLQASASKLEGPTGLEETLCLAKNCVYVLRV